MKYFEINLAVLKTGTMRLLIENTGNVGSDSIHSPQIDAVKRIVQISSAANKLDGKFSMIKHAVKRQHFCR